MSERASEFFGGCLCVAERTLTLQFLQLFHIIIVTLMFLMNVIKTLLFLGCNNGGSLSKLITYSLYGTAGKVGLSAKVGPICHSIPGMQCSQTNNSSIYKPSMGHNSTLYLFLWHKCKTLSITFVS